MRDPKDPGTRRLHLPTKRKPAAQAAGFRLGYARVSTDDQSLDLQHDALQAAGCDQVFEETASGKDAASRPELANLLRAARPGDTLVVWRLDRLGRSLADLVQIVNDLHKRGVRFESLTERIDTSHATGELVFHLFASLAQFERTLIRERTIAGLQAARARGRKGGRKRTLSATKIRLIKAALKDPSVTVEDVARANGVSRSTIYRSVDVAKIQRDPEGAK